MFQVGDARALRTFVARLDPAPGADDGVAQAAAAFGSARLSDGDRRFAVVVSDAVYYVHTTESTEKLSEHAGTLRAALSAAPLGDATTVSWIRPLSRGLQRALGWGDVAATEADVSAAADAASVGDTGPLRELFPWLGSSRVPPEARTPCEDVIEMLPELRRVMAALRGEQRLGPEVCQHVWDLMEEAPWTNPACANGHCPRRLRAQLYDFHRCRSCRAEMCDGCVQAQEEEGRTQRLVEEFRRRLEPGEHVYGCVAHRPHPLGPPEPFYVLNSDGWTADEELAWVTREFDVGAAEATAEDLPAFADLCLCVCDPARGEAQQKTLVFKLWARFAGERLQIRTEDDAPASVRSKLAPLWSTEAVCQDCGDPLGPRETVAVRCTCGWSDFESGGVLWRPCSVRHVGVQAATCVHCRTEICRTVFCRCVDVELPREPARKKHRRG